MVLHISTEPSKEADDYDAYTVHADSHRILTIVTSCDDILSKWLNDVRKFTKNKLPTSLLVGISVERQSLEYAKSGLRDNPYDLLSLCVGSHSLIYNLQESDRRGRAVPRSLRTFFDNDRVVVVGMNMKSVAQKLERDHGIKINNPMDLQKLAMEGMKREDLDLGRYDLDMLAKTVLGKHMDVVRPEEKLQWYDSTCWYCKLSRDKVQYATIDAYLCYLVGSELLDRMQGDVGLSFSAKKTSKRRKN